MAIIRNNTPSRHRCKEGKGYPLPPRVDVPIPDDVVAKWRARPGIERMFTQGLFTMKTGKTRVARMESAPINERPDEPTPPAAGGDEGGAEAEAPAGGTKSKKRGRKRGKSSD